MRPNKCEIIGVIGITAAILLFAMDSALALSVADARWDFFSFL